MCNFIITQTVVLLQVKPYFCHRSTSNFVVGPTVDLSQVKLHFCHRFNWKIVLSQVKLQFCHRLNWKIVLSQVKLQFCHRLNWKIVLSQVKLQFCSRSLRKTVSCCGSYRPRYFTLRKNCFCNGNLTTTQIYVYIYNSHDITIRSQILFLCTTLQATCML